MIGQCSACNDAVTGCTACYLGPADEVVCTEGGSTDNGGDDGEDSGIDNGGGNGTPCGQGYYTDASGSCVACTSINEGCLLCQVLEDAPTCVSCQVGYYSSGYNSCTDCTTLDAQCSECTVQDDNTAICVGCETGYTLYNQTCYYTQYYLSASTLAFSFAALLALLALFL
jgi:hypothetical protein